MRDFTFVTTIVVAVALLSCRSSESGRAPGIYPTRTNEGVVSFQLTPHAPANGTLVVDVQATTHSGDLAEVNLGTAVTLQADGKTYQPASATALRGHHSTGSVTFTLAGMPDRFTVTMSGIRSMDPLRFEWP